VQRPGRLRIPADLLPPPEIARLLGKPFVELSHERVMAAIRFAWKHDLADITLGETAAISYAGTLETALVELVAERAWRLATAGTIPSTEAVIHLTWAELPSRLSPTRSPPTATAGAAGTNRGPVSGRRARWPVPARRPCP
jgi:hypothetical protein